MRFSPMPDPSEHCSTATRSASPKASVFSLASATASERDIRGDDPHIRVLVGQRAGDATGSRAQVGHKKAFASLIHACRRGATKVAPYGDIFLGLVRFGIFRRGNGFPRLYQGLLHGGDGLALLLGGLGVPRHVAGAGRRQSRQHFAHKHLGLGPRNEHAGAHLHGDVPKGHFPGDVLQGLPAIRAAAHSRAAPPARPPRAADRSSYKAEPEKDPLPPPEATAKKEGDSHPLFLRGIQLSNRGQI